MRQQFRIAVVASNFGQQYLNEIHRRVGCGPPQMSRVTLIEECPSRSAHALICKPAASHATAALCRSLCMPIQAMPDNRTARRDRSVWGSRFLVVRGPKRVGSDGIALHTFPLRATRLSCRYLGRVRCWLLRRKVSIARDPAAFGPQCVEATTCMRLEARATTGTPSF